MQIPVTEADLQPSQVVHSAPSHPIARALHRSIGGQWLISTESRLACELFAPFRVIFLPESVALFLKEWQGSNKAQPFTFEISDIFAPASDSAAAGKPHEDASLEEDAARQDRDSHYPTL